MVSKKRSTVTAGRAHPMHTVTRNITFFKKVNVQEQGRLTFGDFKEEISSHVELDNENYFSDNDMLFQADPDSKCK